MASARPQDAYERALKLLSLRARTRHELHALLSRRGHPEGELSAALARLEELGYVDDERFARDRAVALLRDAHLGPTSVQARLRAHGLPEELCALALARAQEELGFDAYRSAGELLLRRRLGGRPLGVKEHARAARLLLTRGFEQEVVERLLGEPKLDPEDDGG